MKPILELDGGKQYVKTGGVIEDSVQELKAIPHDIYDMLTERLGSFVLTGTTPDGSEVGCIVRLVHEEMVFGTMTAATNKAFMELGKQLGYTFEENGKDS